MSAAEDRDFAVTFDPKYGWWSALCMECGATVEYRRWLRAMAFIRSHRRECPDDTPEAER